MDHIFEFGFSVFTDNANISLLRFLSKYEKAEKKGFENISARDVMELGFETMFMAQVFEKELSKLNVSGPEKLALKIVRKYKKREFVDPIDKNYIMFTIWRNDEGFLKYTLEDIKKQNYELENGFEKADSYLVPAIEVLPYLKQIFLKIAMDKNLF
ncbi:conserved hypothetical protein [Methanococcus maripaludis C5]|uniref:Uncharacterized protein n=1 Tax=Methanococcus maripaludis (strain C5 / ATCC BAA-1333) TaxID=402880 RepID=A4FYW7_METM5|nr:hypothetical protein [Methanococcus maripaludis]ABO35401.1 conserved hypothetical protein [Methanococcus maripaludis C5]